MTPKSAERRQSDGEINPKIGPAPNSNTEKSLTTGSPEAIR
jgi:hypothetical protein